MVGCLASAKAAVTGMRGRDDGLACSIVRQPKG